MTGADPNAAIHRIDEMRRSEPKVEPSETELLISQARSDLDRLGSVVAEYDTSIRLHKARIAEEQEALAIVCKQREEQVRMRAATETYIHTLTTGLMK